MDRVRFEGSELDIAVGTVAGRGRRHERHDVLGRDNMHAKMTRETAFTISCVRAVRTLENPIGFWAFRLRPIVVLRRGAQ